MTRNTLPILVIVSIVTSAGASSTGNRRHRARQQSQQLSTPGIPYFGPARGLPSSPDNWRGGVGNWSNGADWTAGLPGSSSDVTINTGNDNVTLDTSTSINSLTLGGATGSSALTDNTSTSHIVSIAGALTINQSGNLSLLSFDSLTANANSSNAGAINLAFSGMQFNSAFTNSGNIQMDGFSAVTAAHDLINSGSIVNTDGMGGSLTAASLTNSGTVFLQTVQVTGDLTNQHGGVLTAASLSVGGNLTNSGQLEPFTRPSTFTVTGALINGGVIDGQYTQISAASLQNTGNMSLGGNLIIAGDATNAGNINEGSLAIGGQAFNVNGTFTNAGNASISLQGSDVGAQMTRVMNNGVIFLDSGTRFTVTGDMTNGGRISAGEIAGNDQLSVNGKLSLTPSGSIFLSNTGDLMRAGSISNAGTIVIGSGNTISINTGPTAPLNALPGFLNSGSLNIAAGALVTTPLTFAQTGGATIVDGTLRSTGHGVVNFAGGSVFGDHGAVQGVSILSNAAINIGDTVMSVGQMTFTGNYTQGVNGSLTFDIAGVSPGQYDQLNVSGHAQLNGLMTVDLLQGFVPQIGNSFDIMTFSTSSGTFSTVAGLPINGQEHFVLEYNSSNLTLDVVAGQLAGVSASSGRSFSENPFIAQLTGNDNVLMASTHGGATTPEPASILLLGSGMVGVAGVLRRKGTVKR